MCAWCSAVPKDEFFGFTAFLIVVIGYTIGVWPI